MNIKCPNSWLKYSLFSVKWDIFESAVLALKVDTNEIELSSELSLPILDRFQKRFGFCVFSFRSLKFWVRCMVSFRWRTVYLGQFILVESVAHQNVLKGFSRLLKLWKSLGKGTVTTCNSWTFAQNWNKLI